MIDLVEVYFKRWGYIEDFIEDFSDVEIDQLFATLYRCSICGKDSLALEWDYFTRERMERNDNGRWITSILNNHKACHICPRCHKWSGPDVGYPVLVCKEDD